ncbi:MAG: hypothetical protein AAFY41_14060, partial [Bacteroidota bacterium]
MSSTTDDRPYTLQINNGQETISTHTMLLNSSIFIPSKGLNDRVLFAVLEKDGKKLATNMVTNYKSSVIVDTIPEVYQTRQLVSKTINLAPGNYSIGVRKRDQYLPNDLQRAVDSKTAERPLSSFTDDSIKYLPEARNELVTGKAMLTSGKPAQFQTLTAAIPGKLNGQYINQLQTAITDDKGNFTFHIKPGSSPSELYISSIDTSSYLNVSFEDKYHANPTQFDFDELSLDSAAIKEIVTKSIKNQIENAYYDPLDSQQTTQIEWSAQFTDFDFVYDLDDFKRFNKFEDYFIEYIQGASLKKGKVVIADQSGIPGFEQNQLILLDGVPVNAGEILAFNPLQVKYIRIISKRIYLGKSTFNGMLMIETYDGNLMGFKPSKSVTYPIDKLSFSESYKETNKFEKPDPEIPDQREQLLWLPMVSNEDGSLKLTFITSDIT